MATKTKMINKTKATLGVINPEGRLLSTTNFFTNRSDAALHAVMVENRSMNASPHDGSLLAWKAMRREGFKIVPVTHSVEV